MKITNYIILFLLANVITPITVISQVINPLLYENTWRDNETKTIDGYEITKIFGQLPDNPSTFNYAPITSIGYKSVSFLEANIEKVAEAEKWTPEKLEKNIQNINKTTTGGQFQIYLTRYNEESANFRWFFIIIRGMDDKDKIWEYNLPYKAPQNPVNSGWWNYTTIKVPVELPDSFYVYFNDKRSRYLSDFKFLVEKSNTK